MKLINKKYRTLKPEIEYLADGVIISQAWKKTHSYIRSFNWYADTLELDSSALNIEDLSKKWSDEIKSSRKKPYKLELVPAAKSNNWVIDSDEGWQPHHTYKDEHEVYKLPIRPLAHLHIRDQTWASTAMLCLADAVESAQGNCAGKNNQVYSYGNRLVCDWKENGKAWFRWGNSEIYRKFFTDYQTFLQRPINVGNSIVERGEDSENIYIVSLDLSKFYDNIDRDILLKRLENVSDDFGNENCKQFWSSLKKIMMWEWHNNDLKFANKSGLHIKKDNGLPQGLVSSGFFANAYMISFDKKIGKNIGQKLEIFSDIYLHDYCRYVDDLRLVVSSSQHDDISIIKGKVEKFVSKLLNSYAGSEVILNKDKTKVTSLSDLDNIGSMASRIDAIQNELSGPTDRDTLDAISGSLEGLLSIENEDNILNESSHPDSSLIAITQFDHDIRSDTLKRFAANRLESILRSKRLITVGNGSDKLKSKRFKNESELLCKKLILAWMKDPSLTVVLRKAIEIYPSSDIFRPVFESIFKRSSFYTENNTQDDHINTMGLQMDYVLSDLFRCCCDFNGAQSRIKYPIGVEPVSILSLGAQYAQKVLSSENQPRDYVKRQALLLLAITGKSAKKHQSSGVNSKRAVLLHKILDGDISTDDLSDNWALFEIAAQITGDNQTYADLLLTSLLESKNNYKVLDIFAKRGGGFWINIWKQLKKASSTDDLSKKLKWAAPQRVTKIQNVKLPLSKIISSESNGFRHEAALIKLALALLGDERSNPWKQIGASPANILVEFPDISACTDWNDLWHPEIDSIEIEFNKSNSFSDPRFATPDWIIDTGTHNEFIIYWIGSILRSAASGSCDCTGNLWSGNEFNSYKGIKTSWFKRRMGMMHSPENLVGEYATVSDWFSELLMKCLQWPGFESTHISHSDIKNIGCIKSLQDVLKERLSKLDFLYCSASNMPTLCTEIKRHNSSSGSLFRIVTIQQLLPKTSDFHPIDPQLNDENTRAIHREHLLSICQVAYKTLCSKLHAEDSVGTPAADLIVFPELAVHIDDQDVIKRLADKTRSMIFAGLVFTNHQGKLVNIARWFIPDYKESGRQWIIRDQGKFHITDDEKKLDISSYRPCQHIIEVHRNDEKPFKISGAICYDATDISLAADLRDITDVFVVVAHNKDVNTFDNMAAALHYHMFQHVVICNTGEFGGSTIQAPYKAPYEKLISHVHGTNQISINVADIDPYAFTREHKEYKKRKTQPAGFSR